MKLKKIKMRRAERCRRNWFVATKPNKTTKTTKTIKP